MTETTLDTSLEERVQEVGRELWERIRGEVPGIFNKGYWQGRMLDWAMRDPSFKIDLLRFVDVLPSLQTSEQITRHLKEYLIKYGRDLGLVMGAALQIAAGGRGFGRGGAGGGGCGDGPANADPPHPRGKNAQAAPALQ